LRIEAEAVRAAAGDDDSATGKTDPPPATDNTKPETHP
jgi:hypothetical protein